MQQDRKKLKESPQSEKHDIKMEHNCTFGGVREREGERKRMRKRVRVIQR